jgi:hypothetical protein
MKMIHIKLALLALCIGLIQTTNAEDMAKPASPPIMNHGGGMRHGVGGMMGQMSEEQKEQHLKMMQEHLLAMHDLSNQILAEKDAAKKELLKKQQLDLMKAHHAHMMKPHKPAIEPPKK